MTEAPPDPFAALRSRFLLRLADQRAELERLAARDDKEAIVGIVHKIAGIAGSLGFPDISARAKDAERWLLDHPDAAATQADPLDGLLRVIADHLANTPPVP